MTAYDLRISYWSSDVCASDLALATPPAFADPTRVARSLENSGLSLEARLLDAARGNGYPTFTGDWKASLLGLIAALAPYPATAQADSRSDLPPPKPLRELPRPPRGQRAPWRAHARSAAARGGRE